MIYKDFKELKLSALGFGTMRLPLNSEDITDINEELTQKMFDYAFDKGINYFDTGYGYHKGASEVVMGKYLSRYPRKKYYVATKFPGYDLKCFGHEEEIFKEQLERTKVDYFDFYLMHNVCELNIDKYLDKNIGCVEYFIEQKKLGKIKHLGFSAHADYDCLERYLEVYGNEMEFCQIQLNWIDWTLQDAKKKVELLNKYNIPVWVMEPLRGGNLLKIDESKLTDVRSLTDSPMINLSFDFIRSIDGVKMILSGMSDFEQVKQNISIFEKDTKLTKEEFDALVKLGKDMVPGVPCTGCRYCMSKCPKGINIPKLMLNYNEYKVSGENFIVRMVIDTQEEGKKPADCIGCRSCEKVCPQKIKISEMLKELRNMYNK